MEAQGLQAGGELGEQLLGGCGPALLPPLGQACWAWPGGRGSGEEMTIAARNGGTGAVDAS